MTVVVGITDGERVWMASDTLGVNGWDQKHDAGPKIIRRAVAESGECLIGVSGDGALLAMIRHDLDVPCSVRGDAWDADRWAYDVARKITDLCRDAKPDVMNESGKGMNASILLGFVGRLWTIATNQAWPVESFAAIGSGDEYAMGVMHATETVGDLRPQERLYLAVQAACRFDLHCGGDLRLETA